jgi:hypothetical protein
MGQKHKVFDTKLYNVNHRLEFLAVGSNTDEYDNS